MKRFAAIVLSAVCLFFSLQGCAAPQDAARPTWGALDRETIVWYRSTRSAANS